MTDDPGVSAVPVPRRDVDGSRPGEPDQAPRMLLVEDLMLLLLDDDGASVRGAGTLYYTLGGALLVELALLGRLELDEDGRGMLNGPVVRPVGSDPLPDPLLQEAFEKVSRRPQRVQALLVALGADVWTVVLGRLAQKGLITQEEHRVLGIFRTTRWPAQDEHHEEELRRRVLAVLVDGAEPDARTAAVIGLLFASGTMPALSPPVPWTGDTVRRAQKLQDGDWGAAAVATAVGRTAAAIAAAAALTTATAVTNAASTTAVHG